MGKKSYDIDKNGHITWQELDFRDKVAYTMAIILIASGIVMAFLCFFLTGDYSITDGVLFYVSEAFVTGGALLGIATYVKSKFGQISNFLHDKLEHEDA
jgi:hypothetical protein